MCALVGWCCVCKAIMIIIMQIEYKRGPRIDPWCAAYVYFFFRNTVETQQQQAQITLNELNRASSCNTPNTKTLSRCFSLLSNLFKEMKGADLNGTL